jgi:hypothetical protein
MKITVRSEGAKEKKADTPSPQAHMGRGLGRETQMGREELSPRAGGWAEAGPFLSTSGVHSSPSLQEDVHNKGRARNPIGVHLGPNPSMKKSGFHLKLTYVSNALHHVSVYTCACPFTLVYTQMCVGCTCVYEWTRIRVHKHMHIHVYLHTCVYKWTCTLLCTVLPFFFLIYFPLRPPVVGDEVILSHRP